MSDTEEWHGWAGVEVQKCIAVLSKAQRSVAEAKKELLIAQGQEKAAERDLDTAKRVYYAGRKDQDQHLPKISTQKKEWLRALAKYNVFGSGEMRDAAKKIGWPATDAALRNLAKSYRDVGFFIRLGHGAMRLDQSRVSKALGEPLNADEKLTEDTTVLDQIDQPEVEESVIAEQPRRFEDDNVYDEDPPY